MTSPTLKPAGIPQWTLGDRMRKAREYAGFDQVELAEMIEIARQSVSNYERSTHRPQSRWVLRRWAEITGVDYRWLAFGQEPGDAGGTAELPHLDSNQEPSVGAFEGAEPTTQEILSLRKQLRVGLRGNNKITTQSQHSVTPRNRTATSTQSPLSSDVSEV